MAYTIANWACVSGSLNQGQETIVPFLGVSTVINAPNLFTYGSPVDAVAAISAANYFLPEYASLCVGDIILGFGTDASFALQVTAVSATSVTTESMGLMTNIGTANLVNNAVTYAKLQQASVGDVLLANPTGAAANYQEVTLGNGLAFSGTSLELSPLYDNYAEVVITAAQFNGMYAAPVQIVAAPGANELLILDRLALEMTFNSADYAAGGVVALQYGATADGAGIIASSTNTAASFQAAASTTFLFGNSNPVLPYVGTVNTGLYLSNLTAAFTTGNSPFTAKIWYKVVPSNS